MQSSGSWCTKKYLKRVRSTDILIRRRSVDTPRKCTSLKTKEVAPTPRTVDTPKRRLRMLSPGGYIEIMGSPETKRYASVRKIDFND